MKKKGVRKIGGKKRLRDSPAWDVPDGYPGQSTALGRAFRQYRPWALWGGIVYLAVSFLITRAILTWAGIFNIGMALGMQVLQIVIYFGFFFWYLAGRISVKVYYPGDLPYRWDDFVGLPSIKQRAQMLVSDLTDRETGRTLGGIRPAHALFTGKPGTGKTHLAKIIAATAGVPVMVVSAGSLMGTFVGIGRLKVVQLFMRCFRLDHIWGGVIMFWDEIDSIGGARGGGSQTYNMMGGSPGMQVLNEILTQLSGIGEASGHKHRLRAWLKRHLGVPYQWRYPNFLVIAATNRPDILDVALTRSGRLEQKIDFPLPQRDQMAEVVDYYLHNWRYDEGSVGVPHSDECTAEAMAWLASGGTPADVERAMNDAKRLAKLHSRTEITFEDWSMAITEGRVGLRQPLPLSRRDRMALAYHEAGHALTVLVFAEWSGEEHRVPMATIIRFGEALGHITHLPIEEHILQNQDDIEFAIMVSLGSLAAETVSQARTPGTSADLQSVQYRVRLMISQGMIGNPFMIKRVKEAPGGQAEIALGDLTDTGLAVATAYYDQRVLDAIEAMKTNHGALTALAEALADREILLHRDIQEIVEGLMVPCEIKPFVWGMTDKNTRRG